MNPKTPQPVVVSNPAARRDGETDEQWAERMRGLVRVPGSSSLQDQNPDGSETCMGRLALSIEAS